MVNRLPSGPSIVFSGDCMNFPGRRATMQDAALVVFGAALGLLSAYFVAQRVQERLGYAELDRYAERLQVRGIELNQETNAAILGTLHDGQAFCSNGDLEYMRAWVYNAHHIRDIGRVRDGKLYCTTGVGRLPVPLAVPPPDIDVKGVQVFAHIPLQFSDRSVGFIVSMFGVSVVLNPSVYQNLDEPPMTFSGMMHIFTGDRLVRGFGHDMPITDEQVLRGERIVLNGVVYRPLCAHPAAICVVAAEPYAALMAHHFAATEYVYLVGVVLGLAGGLIVALLLRTRRSLEQQLRRAIRRNALTLEYQPIFDLQTSELVSCEALARWTNEDGKPVLPARFVALAEDRGFLSDITRLVLKTTLHEIGDLLRSTKLQVVVNMATQDLHDPAFPEYLARCLAEVKVAPESVGLELTERSTADEAHAISTIDTLQSRGHAIYIDDFGTGYSSLAYLHRLSVHGIKIDQSFTHTIGTGAVTASVIPQILQMSRELNLLVVVEGIETPEQAEYFKSATGLKVLGQGFYFSKPLSAEQLRKLVTRT